MGPGGQGNREDTPWTPTDGGVRVEDRDKHVDRAPPLSAPGGRPSPCGVQRLSGEPTESGPWLTAGCRGQGWAARLETELAQRQDSVEELRSHPQ